MMERERFEANKNLIPAVYLRRFSQYPYLREELFEEGLVGLWRAAKFFDESKGVQFSTFAFITIFRAMRRYVRFVLDGYHCVSMEEVVAVDGDGSKITYNDILQSQDRISEELLSYRNEIRNLPEEQRIICDMMEQGFRQEEVGKALGISQSKVSRELQKIAKEIKK